MSHFYLVGCDVSSLLIHASVFSGQRKVHEEGHQALRDVGQPFGRERPRHRHLLVCPRSNRPDGDEVVLQQYRVRLGKGF